MNKITKVQAGIAGEYLVAAELTKLGYVVTLASKNTENFDALVSREDASKAIGIQIKTNQYNQPKWIMSYKNEKLHNNNLFYVFVILGEHNEFYIVPSEIVSKEIKEDYEKWMDSPRKDGDKHNETTMRTFKDKDKIYLGRWDLIEKALR